MKKYMIVIEETVSGEFEVTAESPQEAMEIAEDKYKNGEFVLAPGEVSARQMAILYPDKDVEEWTPF